MNDSNLISLGERTKDEQRAIARKGGIASGESRRQKAALRDVMQAALSTDHVDAVTGNHATWAERITANIVRIAANSENPSAAVRAYETILKMTGQDKPEDPFFWDCMD